MGMYDTVLCEYELPLPDEVKELKNPPDWKKWEFQTKSIVAEDSFFLGGFGDTYTIEDDGQLYKEIIEREVVEQEDGQSELIEKDRGIEKQFFTGEIRFYNLHMEEKHDYWIEFLALFWKGELKEISLGEWEKHGNTQRIEVQERVKEAVKKASQKKEPSFLGKFVRLVCYMCRWVLNLFTSLTWKIERWFS